MTLQHNGIKNKSHTFAWVSMTNMTEFIDQKKTGTGE